MNEWLRTWIVMSTPSVTPALVSKPLPFAAGEAL